MIDDDCDRLWLNSPEPHKGSNKSLFCDDSLPMDPRADDRCLMSDVCAVTISSHKRTTGRQPQQQHDGADADAPRLQSRHLGDDSDDDVSFEPDAAAHLLAGADGGGAFPSREQQEQTGVGAARR